uniref:Uncharacterized protein n=1 Tax=viral metagenome TaxID=1070528 RepID=A0A6M3LN17_9ZZZZ
MTKKDFLKMMQQKEKELFHPLLNEDSEKNTKMLKDLTITLMKTLVDHQKTKGDISGRDMQEYVRGMIVGWESRDKI